MSVRIPALALHWGRSGRDRRRQDPPRATAVDTAGTTLLSVKLLNDQAEIDAVIGAVSQLADQVQWAVDIVGAPAALLLALLAQAGQQVRYASGRVVAAMSAAFTGEGKTDAKDAHVIAETARLRLDLTVVDHSTDLARNLTSPVLRSTSVLSCRRTRPHGTPRRHIRDERPSAHLNRQPVCSKETG